MLAVGDANRLSFCAATRLDITAAWLSVTYPAEASLSARPAVAVICSSML